MFNNTFFAKPGRTCKIGGKKVRYAAVCNAVAFATRSRRKKKRRTVKVRKTGRVRKTSRVRKTGRVRK